MNTPDREPERISYFRPEKTRFRLKFEVTAVNDAKSITEGKIWVDGTELLPEFATQLRPFYPNTFSWGDLMEKKNFTTSLAICLFITRNQRIALNIFREFQREFVGKWPKESFETDIDIAPFLRKNKSRLHPHLSTHFIVPAIFANREIDIMHDPDTGKYTADLAGQYGREHGQIYPPGKKRQLEERKNRLVFRRWARDDSVISGYNYDKVTKQVHEVMDRFSAAGFEKFMASIYRGSGKGYGN